MLVRRFLGVRPVHVVRRQQRLGDTEPGRDEVPDLIAGLRELQLTVGLAQLLEARTARHERHRLLTLPETTEQCPPAGPEGPAVVLGHAVRTRHDVVGGTVPLHQPGVEPGDVLGGVRVVRPRLKLTTSAPRVGGVEPLDPQHFLRAECLLARAVPVLEPGHELHGVRDRFDVVRHHPDELRGGLALHAGHVDVAPARQMQVGVQRLKERVAVHPRVAVRQQIEDRVLLDLDHALDAVPGGLHPP